MDFIYKILSVVFSYLILDEERIQSIVTLSWIDWIVTLSWSKSIVTYFEGLSKVNLLGFFEAEWDHGDAAAGTANTRRGSGVLG